MIAEAKLKPKARGISCPRCYRTENEVRSTVLRIGSKWRYRKCLNCRHAWRTEER